MGPSCEEGPLRDPRLSVAPAQPDERPSPGGGDPAVAAAGYDVAVIDDDEDTLEALASVLEFGGYRVLSATSGQQALASMRGLPPPRLVLLDLVMPGMSGDELLDELRHLPGFAGVPVVLFSGLGELERRSAQLDVAGFLQKPGSLEELLDIVHQHAA